MVMYVVVTDKTNRRSQTKGKARSVENPETQVRQANGRLQLLTSTLNSMREIKPLNFIQSLLFLDVLL